MVYITQSNANKIIQKVDLKHAEFSGAIYKNKIWFYNKYEENKLLAIKEFLKNPESFADKYKKHETIDTYTYIYEGSRPSYHKDQECLSLLSNYKNFKIPEEIKSKGKDEIFEFRNWFKSVEHLLADPDKSDILVARINARWGIVANPKSISYNNSGLVENKNYSLNDIVDLIDKKLKDASDFYYLNKTNKDILKKYAKHSYRGYEKELLSIEGSGYGDEFIKDILKEYDLIFKTPLKRLLVEYYRITLNPELSFDGKILDVVGFKPCLRCHNI